MYRFLEYTVGEWMTHPVHTVTRHTSLQELEALFARYDFNAFPVLEGDNVGGVVTKFDFLKAFAFTTGQMVPHYDELIKQTVGAVMTEAVVSVDPSSPLTRTLQLMVSLKARSFPVIAQDGNLVGIIAREDILRALKEATQSAAA